MLKIQMSALAIVTTLVVSGPAHADWHGTEWGDSQTVVITKSNIELTVPTQVQKTSMLNNKYGTPDYIFNIKLKEFSFQGRMFFGKSGLTMIGLGSDEPGACSSVINYLGSKFGNPDMVGVSGNGYSTTIPEWIDYKNKNLYKLFEIDVINSCDIQIVKAPKHGDSI